MQRRGWTSGSSHTKPEPGPETDANVLIPESDEDRQELRRTLEERGVGARGVFDRDGMDGLLDVPDTLAWEHDGALQLAVACPCQVRPVDVWFWVVESYDRTGPQHHVRSSLSRDPAAATDWNQ